MIDRMRGERSFIVHCLSGGASGLGGSVRTTSSFAQAETIRKEWFRKGALRVEVRLVDGSRDWNDTSDPVVQQAARDERDEMEGRWQHGDA